MSGSTNAADIAERRKLEAELNEAKEGLNDTYYDHAKDQQQNALDDEANAFRTAKEKWIEELREFSKDETAVLNDMFLNGIFNADVAKQFLDGISEKYGVPLSKELTEPWAAAEKTAIDFKNRVGIIAGTDIPPSVTMISDDIVKELGTDDENNPWNKALNMADKYADFLTSSEFSIDNNDMTTFEGQINNIVSGWNNVKLAADAAYEAQTREVTVGGVNTNTSGSNNTGSTKTSTTSGSNNNVAALQAVLNTVFSAGLVVDGKMGSATTSALKTAQSKLGITADGKYGPTTKKAIETYIDNQIASWRKIGGGSQVNQGIQAYQNAKNQLPLQLAKGTMGLEKDQLAITDEPWLGDELVLVPTEAGNLSYMRKGTSVIPASLTENLVEWGRLNPDMLKVGRGANINMISNAINKPEINLDIAEFLHVDKVDKDTMADLEKFVDKKMNDLVRKLNYSIKKFK